MEATGDSRWFERLLAELGFELWIGDPAEIRAKRVKKQKTDRNDARLLRRLMLENSFPQIWIPTPENRDLRQLLWHRHRLVQMRTRIMNQLQALAMNEGEGSKFPGGWPSLLPASRVLQIAVVGKGSLATDPVRAIVEFVADVPDKHLSL